MLCSLSIPWTWHKPVVVERNPSCLIHGDLMLSRMLTAWRPCRRAVVFFPEMVWRVALHMQWVSYLRLIAVMITGWHLLLADQHIEIRSSVVMWWCWHLAWCEKCRWEYCFREECDALIITLHDLCCSPSFVICFWCLTTRFHDQPDTRKQYEVWRLRLGKSKSKNCPIESIAISKIVLVVWLPNAR